MAPLKKSFDFVARVEVTRVPVGILCALLFSVNQIKRILYNSFRDFLFSRQFL